MAVRDVLVIEGRSSLAVRAAIREKPILAKGWAAASAHKTAPPDSATGAIPGWPLCGANACHAASSAIIPAAVLLIGMW